MVPARWLTPAGRHPRILNPVNHLVRFKADPNDLEVALARHLKVIR